VVRFRGCCLRSDRLRRRHRGGLGGDGPVYYGRWNAAAQTHWEEGQTQVNEAAAEVFGSEGAFDPAATRAALAALDLPVLVLAGLDDAGQFAAVVSAFLDG
jgi:proline iminopeptidase